MKVTGYSVAIEGEGDRGRVAWWAVINAKTNDRGVIIGFVAAMRERCSQ